MKKPPHLIEAPKITVLPVITSLDVPTERVLQAAMDNQDPLQSVVVIGYTADSDELYFASSVAGGPDVLWMLEKAKQKLLEIGGD